MTWALHDGAEFSSQAYFVDDVIRDGGMFGKKELVGDFSDNSDELAVFVNGEELREEGHELESNIGENVIRKDLILAVGIDETIGGSQK